MQQVDAGRNGKPRIPPAQLLEQELLGLLHKFATIVEVSNTVAQRGRELIQLVEGGLRIEVRVVEACDIERGTIEAAALAILR